jgi:hypothetical protein
MQDIKERAPTWSEAGGPKTKCVDLRHAEDTEDAEEFQESAALAIKDMLANGAVFRVLWRDGLPDVEYELPRGGDRFRCRVAMLRMRAWPHWPVFRDMVLSRLGRAAA